MSESKSWRDDPLYAYAGPFIVFMLGLAAVGLFKQKEGTVWQTNPEFWIYPLQTLLCAVALGLFWKHYDFKPLTGKAVGLGVVAGLVILAIWIPSRSLLGPYTEGLVDRITRLFTTPSPASPGFNPDLLAGQPGLYYGTILTRMIRLSIVVPFVEELFWRGFLMRYLIKEEFQTVPLGTLEVRTFSFVAIAFMLVHGPADWPAALATGAIFGGLMVWTRSLGACVIAHAVVNFLLGLYILTTKRWEFW